MMQIIYPKNFLTQHLQTLEMLDKKVSSLCCCISNTYKILGSRFTRDTVAAYEKKRVKRRKKERERKKIKRQKYMEMKLALRLLVKTNGNEVTDSFLECSPKQKLSAKQLGTVKLLPRFHIKALEYLIKMDAVDDVKQTETCLTTLRARKWPIRIVLIHLTQAKMIPGLKKPAEFIIELYTFLCVDKVVVIDSKLACYYSYVKITLFKSRKNLGAPLVTPIIFPEPPPPQHTFLKFQGPPQYHLRPPPPPPHIK